MCLEDVLQDALAVRDKELFGRLLFFRHLTIVFGGLLEKIFESAGKGGIIPETAIEANLGEWQFTGKQQLSLQQAFVGNVLVDAVAGFGFKFAHHMEFAQIEFLR